MTFPCCRACDAPLSHTFVDLGMSPLANSYVLRENMNKAEKFYPLHVFVCESCRLVQLAEFESPEYIFSDEYAYFSSFSKSWLEHAQRYADNMIVRFGLSAVSHVVEVASNDGYLLQWFVGKGIPVTGIEPAGNCADAAEAKGVPTETVFFGTRTACEITARRGKADLIVANNVLAHVPNIRDFVGGFTQMLKLEGVATFEFPHLLNLITLNQFDTIYHEHFSYLSMLAVTRVFERQGLRIFDVEELSTHGGSLRLFVCLAGAAHEKTGRVDALLSKELSAGLDDLSRYDDYDARVVTVKDALLEFLIAARRAGKTVCGYGAPAKGNTLLNYCGVGPEYVAFTVDRNPAKQNTLLPGTRIPVFPVDEIFSRKPDYVLILPWNLNEEIRQSMSAIRGWGWKFVTAIPQLDVS